MTDRADLTGTGGERGQALQVPVTAAQLGLAGPVPASGDIQSALIKSNGYTQFALGLTSSQVVSVSIQRYLDNAGTIAQGPPVTGTLTTAVPETFNLVDGMPFATLQITITNGGGTNANLTNVGALWQSGP